MSNRNQRQQQSKDQAAKLKPPMRQAVSKKDTGRPLTALDISVDRSKAVLGFKELKQLWRAV